MLWPWSVKSAVVLAPFALIVLIVAAEVSRAVAAWPSARYDGWLLVGIVFLSLLPILLLILEALAAWGANLSLPGGVSLSFAGAAESLATAVPTATLAANLGTVDDVPVAQTSLRSVLRALRQANSSDVTVVDLRGGHTWWESRLFILVAGAAERARPQAIAFVAQRNGQPTVFLGWATPDRLLDMHLTAVPALAEAYAKAQASAARWRIGTPVQHHPGAIPSVTFPWAPATAEYLPSPEDELADPRFAMELYLQQALDMNYPQLRQHVTIQRLHDVFEAELVTDSIDADADDAAWAALLNSRPQRFFAVTVNGRFKRLVARDALVTTMLARLVTATDRES